MTGDPTFVITNSMAYVLFGLASLVYVINEIIDYLRTRRRKNINPSDDYEDTQ